MTRSVGPRGLTVLVLVGFIGLALAILGWTHSGTAPVDQQSGRIAVYVVGTGATR
ncbi:MAG: hypothetical protein WBF34_24645 [Streptosporangiaceae bacterium]|jgi:hypothetical protein